MLNIQKAVENDAACLALEGRPDNMSAPELEQVLKETLPGLTAIKLDFAKLDFISSAGLRVMLCAQKQMNRQREMKLTNVKESIMEIFAVTGFVNILTIV